MPIDMPIDMPGALAVVFGAGCMHGGDQSVSKGTVRYGSTNSNLQLQAIITLWNVVRTAQILED